MRGSLLHSTFAGVITLKCGIMLSKIEISCVLSGTAGRQEKERDGGCFVSKLIDLILIIT